MTRRARRLGDNRRGTGKHGHARMHLTAGNVDDRQPPRHLRQGLVGKLIGDKGYLSQPLLVWRRHNLSWRACRYPELT